MESGWLPAAPVRFGVLGPLLADAKDGPVVLSSAKQRALLAVLLLEASHDLVSTERLIDDLWGETPPATAHKALQVHVSQLRRLLGHEDLIVTRPGGYAIHLEPGALDLHRFETLLSDARGRHAADDLSGAQALLGEALALWRGPALADVPLLGGGAAEADRLEGLRAVAREERLEIELELGRGAALVPELEGLIARDPYRERLHALLMHALYRAGRQADALEAFRRARALLVGDLGLEPGPELARLEAAILAQDPSLDAPAMAPPRSDPPADPALSHTAGAAPTPASPAAAASDPGPSPGILGRDAELEAALRLIDDPDVRVVTLTGVGGIGKTRLMREIAARLGSQTHLVELAAIDDPDRVLPAIAAAVGAQEASATALASALDAAAPVLLLDNFEQVLGAARVIAAVLAEAPAVTAVVTSRAPLRIERERELPLPPLARDPAVELFLRRAREQDARFDPTASELREIAEICERIDGVPLAIELAAARTSVLTVDQILQRIGRRLDLLGAGRRDAPARHRTLRATIAWSHDLLEPEAQRLFERLAVFQGGWSVEAAEEIAEAWVVDTLSALRDHALIVREGDRFRMLETVREYAAERLAQSPEAAAVRRRHALWCVKLAELAEPELEGAHQEEWFARLDAEQENLRAGAAWGLSQGEPEIALEVIAPLWRFWLARGATAEMRDLLVTALAQDAGGGALRARSLIACGVLSGAAGDFSAAEDAFEQSLALSEPLGDAPLMARALANLGMIATFAADYPTAVSRYERVAAIWEELGNVHGLSVVRQNMAVTHTLTGNFDKAREMLEESVELARATGDRVRVAATITALARVLAFSRVDDPQVPELLREGLDLTMTVGERVQTVWLLDVVAQFAASRGQPTIAAELIGAADAGHERSGTVRPPDQLQHFEETVQALEQALGHEAFERLRERGRELELEAAVQAALETTHRPAAAA